MTAFSVGDRAFGLVGGGGLATRVVANERELAAVPDALDAATAAAAPQSFLTAFDAIVMQAGLGAGDLLLVNGASGGVGTAAVQIANALGARVVANVRTPELRPRVAAMGAEALPADEAFARVRELGGADVILELVGGPHMSENMTVAGSPRSPDAGRREARRRGRDRSARPDERPRAADRKHPAHAPAPSRRRRSSRSSRTGWCRCWRRAGPRPRSATCLRSTTPPMRSTTSAPPGKFGKVLLEMPAA